jgi:hypothetical protein
MVPAQLRIKSSDFQETIAVYFSTDNPDEVVLHEMRIASHGKQTCAHPDLRGNLRSRVSSTLS